MMAIAQLKIGNNPSPIAKRKINTPVGDLWLTASDVGLCSLRPPEPQLSDTALTEAQLQQANHILAVATSELQQYFTGSLTTFSVPLAPQGTVFQQQVWQQLLAIPFGKTTSYGEIAQKMAKPKAARAVGAANGANKIAIIIPCHRVIGKQGALTGYAWGVSMKQQLIDIEAKVSLG